MYGLETNGIGYLQEQKAMQAFQPSEEDLKRENIRHQIWRYSNLFQEAGKSIALLTEQGVLSKEEARTILDIDRLLALIEEAKTLSS